MPLPLVPIAVGAAQIGAAVALGYILSRRTRGLPTVTEETAHEAVDEGVSLRHHRTADATQANAQGRFRRTLRFGAGGRGLEIDATALGRIRIKRI